MAYRVGFTGTRQKISSGQYEGLHTVLGDLNKLHNGDVELHHGDCKGADAACHEVAKSYGFRVILHPPTMDSRRAHLDDDCDEVWPAREYLIRNREIVDNTDILVACPQGPEVQRSGTWSTVRYALRQGLTVILIHPDGSIEKRTCYQRIT